MPEQRNGFELRVEVHWCHECGADRTVQIVQLTEDPQPVALCADCGAGIELWLPVELTDPPPNLAHQGAA